MLPPKVISEAVFSGQISMEGSQSWNNPVINDRIVSLSFILSYFYYYFYYNRAIRGSHTKRKEKRKERHIYVREADNLRTPLRQVNGMGNEMFTLANKSLTNLGLAEPFHSY